MRTFRRLVMGLSVAGGLLAIVASRPTPVDSGQGPGPDGVLAAPNGNGHGRTTTLLPDGGWLLIGGAGTTGANGSVAVWDSGTGQARFVASLQYPRAWHSATL